MLVETGERLGAVGVADAQEFYAGTRVKQCLRLSGIVDQSIVDGPGLRMTVFAQGCPHHCPGCHNASTHSFSGGFEVAIDEILAEFNDNPLLAGVTLSGGEPMAQPEAFRALAEGVRAKGKSVWCYTGYTFEELMAMSGTNQALAGLLGCIDVLVDGRYVAALQSLELRYRGSSNQRVLDLPKSLKAGQPVNWNDGNRFQVDADGGVALASARSAC